MLLHVFGTLGGILMKMLPAGICSLRKPSAAPASSPLQTALPSTMPRRADEQVDARIARIIEEIPQRRLRGHV